MFGSLGCNGFKAVLFDKLDSTLGAAIPARFRPLFVLSMDREGLVFRSWLEMWAPDILMRVAGPTRSSFVPSHLKAGFRFSAMCVCTVAFLDFTTKRNRFLTPKCIVTQKARFDNYCISKPLVCMDAQSSLSRSYKVPMQCKVQDLIQFEQVAEHVPSQ